MAEMMSQHTDMHGPGRAADAAVRGAPSADRAGGCVSVRPLGGALPGRNSTEKADGWSGLRLKQTGVHACSRFHRIASSQDALCPPHGPCH